MPARASSFSPGHMTGYHTLGVASASAMGGGINMKGALLLHCPPTFTTTPPCRGMSFSSFFDSPTQRQIRSWCDTHFHFRHRAPPTVMSCTYFCPGPKLSPWINSGPRGRHSVLPTSLQKSMMKGGTTVTTSGGS